MSDELLEYGTINSLEALQTRKSWLLLQELLSPVWEAHFHHIKKKIFYNEVFDLMASKYREGAPVDDTDAASEGEPEAVVEAPPLEPEPAAKVAASEKAAPSHQQLLARTTHAEIPRCCLRIHAVACCPPTTLRRLPIQGIAIKAFLFMERDGQISRRHQRVPLPGGHGLHYGGVSVRPVLYRRKETGGPHGSQHHEITAGSAKSLRTADTLSRGTSSGKHCSTSPGFLP